MYFINYFRKCQIIANVSWSFCVIVLNLVSLHTFMLQLTLFFLDIHCVLFSNLLLTKIVILDMMLLLELWMRYF